ncbi:macrophage receptor MARCO-like [Chironomus tepperi]|uniref:macrophage receptor MARCO-like n=1 Tax=Chironomus tepperi TaxID=113505 RepID=UPI00391F76BE
MKVNYKTFFCVLLVIELYYVQSIDAKRSFGITGRRSKSKSPSVRRGQHGHEGDDHVPVPKPSTPERKKDVGWNTNSQHSTNTQNHGPSAPPLGPQIPQTNRGLYGGQNAAPPPYGSHTNYGHGPPPAYGAPPAYGSHGSYGAPPAYGSHGSYGAPPSYGASMGYNQHNSFGQQPGMYGGGMGSPYMGGSPMMGMPMMGAMPAYQNRGSSFGSGIMTNLFAGLAGYQLAKAFSGGSGHRDREVIIYDNRQLPSNSDGSIPAQQPIAQQTPVNPQTPLGPSSVQAPINQAISTNHDLPQNPTSSIQTQSSTEIPQTPILPASNEYNYWGLPQYGIPLYGYNLPSQITDYYKVETFKPQ